MNSSSSRLKVLCVVGARPNFMKIAPIMGAFNKPGSGIEARLLHTGQHYDAAMKRAFFEQLGIPEPDVDLEVGSGSHAWQTAEIMQRFEPELDSWQPDILLVVGDVNSTIACALVAVKKSVPVIHVEAGLRSFDRGMPEEINRILTDQISELLFTTEQDAEENLLSEGIAKERIHFVGNVMIDTLFANKARAVAPSETLARHKAKAIDENVGFALVTMHRPSNVDDPVILKRLLETLAEISQTLPLIFPLHPRTAERVEKSGLSSTIDNSHITILPPLGYLELLGFMKAARLVLTDSGGIQEETTALGVPCITMRESTERPITVEQGTNTIVGSDTARIIACFHEVMQTGGKVGRIPDLWDGKAAERIAQVMLEWRKKRIAA